MIYKRVWQAQFLRHTLVYKTKNVYFFKMHKWYYYHILIFLLVSDLEKSLKSFISRVQSSLAEHSNKEWDTAILKRDIKLGKGSSVKGVNISWNAWKTLVCHTLLSLIYKQWPYKNQLVDVLQTKEQRPVDWKTASLILPVWKSIKYV